MNFIRKTWDSEFFGREIHELTIVAGESESMLRQALSELDRSGVWAVEIGVGAAFMGQIPLLENVGFRLVDSKVTFITRMTTAAIQKPAVPKGMLRPVAADDLDRVLELTVAELVDNAQFNSRFKRPEYFTRSESIRYFEACNLRAFREAPDLFTVWDVDGEVVGYFNYMRAQHPRFSPLFKGVLTAVAPQYRGHGAHNLMQNHLFTLFGVSAWWLDNTTQMSNLAVLKNHTKAGKLIHDTTLILYRINPTLQSHP